MDPLTLAVAAEATRARLMAREGMSEARANMLLANQMRDADKRKRADYVVDTNRGLEETAAEIDNIIESLREREG